MDFEFTEEQKMFRAAVRDFLKTEYPPGLVRRTEEAGLKESLPVYRKMGEFGFLGVILPEEYGGSGGTWLDLVILNEESGSVLLPGIEITSIVLAGRAIMAWGTEEQKRFFLPRLSSGEIIIAPAWLEENVHPRRSDIRTQVKRVQERLILEGRKSMVSHFDVATHFLVLAKDVSAEGREAQTVLALVEAGRPEMTWHPLRVQSGEWVADLDIREAAVASDASMAGPWADWLKLVDGAKIASAAYSLGAARVALEMGITYVKERIQFGRPIGSFQTIQHKLAETACMIEQARAGIYYAARLGDRGEDYAGEAAIAKLLAGKALEQAAAASAHCHGALGFSTDHDIQFYFRRIKVQQHHLESQEIQKEIIADRYGF